MRTSKLPAVLAVVLAGVACSDNLSAPITTWTGPIAVSNEVPAPTVGGSTLAGTASVTVTGGGTGTGTVVFNVVLTGTPASSGTITAMHIHGGTAALGAAGTTGPIRINLCGASTIATDNRSSATWATCGAGAQTVGGTITWTSGSTALGGTGLTFDQMVTAIRGYNMYVNVHTTSNGAGEARAQLLPPPVTP